MNFDVVNLVKDINIFKKTIVSDLDTLTYYIFNIVYKRIYDKYNVNNCLGLNPYMRIIIFKYEIYSLIKSLNYFLIKSNLKSDKSFLDKYRLDDNLRAKVLDLRRKYIFSAKEINKDDSIIQYYQDTSSLSGGEKAKLTYTILAASIAYQFNLDNYDENFKGPFRFVILDEAFSKSDARNSEYALQLFKELDLQLMVITPRNGINIVEGYVSSLHLLEKNGDWRTSSISSMTIEEYKEVEVANTWYNRSKSKK